MRVVTRDLADGALLVEFPGSANPEANEAAAGIARRLAAKKPPGLLDAIPGARTLFVLFDPDIIERSQLEKLLEPPDVSGSFPQRTVQIPIRYGGEHGPDLDELARGSQLSPSELARLHRGADYRVAFIGFAPGFPYLTGLPQRLHSPRLPSPRPRVRAGSVGIAGEYTGIYPQETPGGWRLIGNAPVRLFDANATPPALLGPGDRVLFEEIGEEDYARLRQKLTNEQPRALNREGAPVLRILSGGLCTSVQGAPHHGLGALGVPSGGAMDLLALSRGNRALKNSLFAPALEITLIGPQIEFLRSARLCLSGSEADAAVNEKRVSLERPFDVRKGDRLSIGSLRTGARLYLCISGGFANAAAVGEPLRRLGRGDELFLARMGEYPARLDGTSVPAPRTAQQRTMRVVLGPQADHFSRAGRECFLTSEYRISAQSDRRGIRLEGPAIELLAPADIPPEGTAPGAIQVPANGLPIILGPDRPVTGGYAKIAAIISADLPSLAQARPGTSISFRAVTMAEAFSARCS